MKQSSSQLSRCDTACYDSCDSCDTWMANRYRAAVCNCRNAFLRLRQLKNHRSSAQRLL